MSNGEGIIFSANAGNKELPGSSAWQQLSAWPRLTTAMPGCIKIVQTTRSVTVPFLVEAA
jgi:hypothetical protein